MHTIAQEALHYLETQKIGVLAVEMQDGSPHAAAVHFAHTTKPFTFLIETGAGTRKVEALMKNGSARASFVVGADTSNMKTLQLDGLARVVQPDEDVAFLKTYAGKFPGREENAKSQNSVHIIFTPTWWRFTDWTTPEGRKVWASE